MSAVTLAILATAAVRALAAAALLLATSLVGFAATPRRLRPKAARTSVPYSLAAGAALVGFSCWVVGGWLGTRAVLPLFVALVAASLVRAREWAFAVRRLARHLAALAAASKATAALVVVPLLVLVPSLLLPLVDSDGLRYHVAFPKIFLLTGRLFYYPWDLWGALPKTAEMLFLLATSCAGGETAKFVHAGFFMASLGVLALASHRGRGDRKTALLAPLLFAASPVALAPASTAFVDHIALYGAAVGVLLCTRKAHPLALGGALALAFTTKLTSAPAVIGIALYAAFRAGKGSRARFLALAALPSAVAIAPYAIHNLRSTGDPFFPLGYGLAGKPIPGVIPEKVRATTHASADVPGFLGIAWGPGSDKVKSDEVVGWQHLVGLVALGLAFTMPKTRPFLAVILPFVPLAAAYRPPSRYLVPALWGLSAFEASALTRVFRRFATPVAALLVLPAFLFAASNDLTGFFALDHLAGRIDRETLLSRVVPGYRAIAFVNARPGGGTVMALDFPAPYYFDRPWIVDGWMNDPPLKVWVEAGASANELLERLWRLDTRYLLVPPGYGGGTPASLYVLATSRAQAEALIAFRSRLKLLTTIDGIDVYEVPPRAR